MHMLRATDPHFVQFGEIYSRPLPGVIKGWHLHELMTLNYACVSGRIKLVLYDDREDPTRAGELMRSSSDRIITRWCRSRPGSERLQGIGTGWRSCELAHHPTIHRRPSGSIRPTARIPYDWAVKHR